MIIEEEVRNYLLSKNMAGIGRNVFTEVPEDLSGISEYILIQKTGNGTDEFLERPVVIIQSISKGIPGTKDGSKHIAAFINEAVKRAMLTFRDEVANVFSCKLNTDYDFTNIQTREYRYQSVWQMSLINMGG